MATKNTNVAKKISTATATEAGTTTVTVAQETKTFSTNKSLDEQGFKTKSAKIRKLHAEGMSTSEIAKQIGVIYQHARNVINQPLKKAGGASAASDPKAVVAASEQAEGGDMRHAAGSGSESATA